jgi:hypothetical protein
MRVSVDGTTGRLPIAPQFHVHNFRTGKDEVYFLPQIAALTLPEADYGRPGKEGEKGTWRCKVVGPSQEAHDEMVEAIRLAGIDFRPGTPFQPTGSQSVEEPSFLVEIEGEFDKLHKRAIAKILMNFVACHLGCHEVRDPRWHFLRHYVRLGEGEIKARLSDQPFWTGQETDRLRLEDDSINVRIENLDGNIVGTIQFYNQLIYELILVENGALQPEQEIARRYTPGEPPLAGEKRPISHTPVSR